jgi:hypothetical protein
VGFEMPEPCPDCQSPCHIQQRDEHAIWEGPFVRSE